MGALDGKIALITGAGAGLGRGIARRFVREGASVVVAELNEEAGKRVEKELHDLGGQALFVRTDVSKKSDCEGAIEATVKRFGRIDALVNNASALSPNILLEQKTDAMLERTLRIGAWGTWWLMQLAMPIMRAQGGGRVINFFSVDTEAGAWLHADYNMTKAAIQALTQSAAMEWARFNILVNAIAPTGKGTVYEELTKGAPQLGDLFNSMNPLGRVGDAEEDIAPVVVFLASEWSRYVTGETIHVDGGIHIIRYPSKPADLSAFEQK